MATPPAATRPMFKPPLAPGDIAPDCALKALGGETVDLRGDAIAGHPLVLVFCPRFSREATEALDGFREDRFLSAPLFLPVLVRLRRLGGVLSSTFFVGGDGLVLGNGDLREQRLQPHRRSVTE